MKAALANRLTKSSALDKNTVGPESLLSVFFLAHRVPIKQIANEIFLLTYKNVLRLKQSSDNMEINYA